MNFLKISIVSLIMSCFPLTAGQKVAVPAKVQGILEKYCTDCHGAKKKKGDIRLHDIANLENDFQSNILNKVEEQLYIEKMPPDDEDQLSKSELQELEKWISSQYKVLGEASKFQAKLKTPAFGNYVNHEDLFSGKYKDLKAFTADRRWLINEFIFTEKINQVMNLTQHRKSDGKRVFIKGSSHRGNSRTNFTNPFLLSSGSGVRYYDNTMLNGGHLLTMITNAKELSKYLMNERQMRSLAPLYKVMKLEFSHDKTLERHKKFLNENIRELMQEIYGNKNKSYLPKFVSLNMKANPVTPDGRSYILPSGKKVKKPVYDTAKPTGELPAITTAVKKYLTKKQSTAELIRLCEKEWFEFGVSKMKLGTRVGFMVNYIEEIPRRHKIKPDTYKPKVFKEADLKTYKEMILKHRKKGDFHNVVIERCLDEWKRGFEAERKALGRLKEPEINDIVKLLFVKILDREPNDGEIQEHQSLIKSYIETLGRRQALTKFIETLVLRSEFAYRYEFGDGKADQQGRKMMSPEAASNALAYAITDNAPDKELRDAVKKGKLSTREDYKREVERMLKRRDLHYLIDERSDHRTYGLTNTPIRKLRFFREFFGYHNFPEIFKDNERLGANYDKSKIRLLQECDQLVDHIISKDKNVFEELLTSDEYYVYHSGDNEKMKEASDKVREIYNYFKKTDWQNFKTAEDLAPHIDFITKVKMSGIDPKRLKAGGRYNPLKNFMSTMESYEVRFGKGQKSAVPYPAFFGDKGYAQNRAGSGLGGRELGKYFNIDYGNWDYPTTQPFKLPNRKGILSHPAWLMAYSQNTETDPVLRGKWIREKLLAGTIPDVPITVEAVVPEDHHKTFRSRLEKVTEVKYCWRCHELMNPLGYAFEMFDDFGRFRTKESLEHPDNLIKKATQKKPLHIDMRAVYKTLPVKTDGYLKGTGDDKLDGEVKNALDLVERLAKSARVRQSIIRHAFRYFIGRNEVLSDSKALIDADQAYLRSDGSFDAVIVSLLTSDSFIYRKKIKEQ
jgi:cytochrome c553